MWTDKTNQAILDRIVLEFFTADTLVTIRRELEGMDIGENGMPVLGLRAGPCICEGHLLHEMSHFVEIQQCRMAKYGWGLKYGSRAIYIPGRYSRVINEYDTPNATMREIRTMAYQWNLLQHFQVDEESHSTAAELVSSLTFMPDIYNLKRPEGVKELEYCEQLMLEYAAKPEYSVEAFKAEWFRRNKLLKRRLRDRERRVQASQAVFQPV